MTAVLEDLQSLSDDDLAGMYRAADDTAARAVLAEFGRRDAADRVARARSVLGAIRHEAECAVHAQFLAASEWTRGRLLSREGMAAGIAERDLWRLPAARAVRFFSEELADYFEFVSPRITVAGYVRQQAGERRAARTEALDQAAASAEITDQGVTDDQHAADGPGLADHEPGALRFVSAAADAESGGGAGWPVRSGGRGASEAEASKAVDARTERPGRLAEPARGVSTMTPAYITFAEIEPLAAEPLWPGYWPRGEVVGWYGEGGIGKGRAEIDLAARVTRGDPMPFCTGRTRPGSVILALPEDHPQEQVRPRLDAAGADVSRVIDMTRLPAGARFKLSADMKHDGDVGKLREVIEALKVTCAACRKVMTSGRCPECGGTGDMNPRLVILDPLTALIGWGSIQTVAGARRAIEPLQDLAQSTGVTILLVMHTTQAGTLQGSAGVRQALRLLYKVSKDVNPMVRVISLDKANNLGEVADAKFTLEDTGNGVKVVWLDRAEQDRRARSWRTPVLAAVPDDGAVPGRQIAALFSVQRPGQARPSVMVLASYPASPHAARLARARCEADPRFRHGAQWRPGRDGDQLARWTSADGTVTRFAVAALAGEDYGTADYGSEASR